jgi:eukaryotic-like serine/threonine-protein kinase
MPKRRRPPKIRLSRRQQKAAAVATAVLLVYFLVDFIIMPLYTRQGQEVAVPSLVGLNLLQAKTRADSSGFELVEEPAKIGGGVPEGTVLEQHPSAGALAKPGRKVRVIPAVKAAPNATPDVVGLELRDAQLRSKNVGLVCGDSDVRYRFSDRAMKGVVMAQDPTAGTAIEPGEIIKLTVSLGPQPAHLYVPYLMEKQLSEARTILRDAGLRLGKIVRKETDLYPNGTVIAQSVKSGEEVERETAIDIVVAVPKKSD